MIRHMLATILLLSAFAAGAQDKIYTKLQKTPIECEVTEITVNEIKYKPVGRPTPIITIDKQDVIKIVYQSGEVMMINNPLKDFTLYTDQHKWNAKVSLLSPLVGYTQIMLEHSQKPGRSVEYEINLIGLGKNQYLTEMNNPQTNGSILYHMNAKGAGLGIGMKFMRMPDYVNGQVRLRHIMQGSYIRPGITLNVYSRNFEGIDANLNRSIMKKTCFSINPNITFGRQWIFDNTISLEFFGTVGLSVDNVRSNEHDARKDNGSTPFFYYDNTPFNNFGYTRFSTGDMGLSLNAGLRVGYLFDFRKKKGDKK